MTTTRSATARPFPAGLLAGLFFLPAPALASGFYIPPWVGWVALAVLAAVLVFLLWLVKLLLEWWRH